MNLIRPRWNWRKERDSNPQDLSAYRFSRPALSPIQPSFQKNFADPRIGSNDHLPVTIRAFSVPVVTVLAPLATTHRVLKYAGPRDSNLLQKNMVGDERVELPCKHYQCFIIDRYINRLKLDASCFYVTVTPRGFHDPGGIRTRIFNFT